MTKTKKEPTVLIITNNPRDTVDKCINEALMTVFKTNNKYLKFLARKQAISKAVDVVNKLKSEKFLPKTKILEIKPGTEKIVYGNDTRPRPISNIAILVECIA
ncbi:MAG: hypothetical protein EAX96_06525 [Candidatus Lokiarchaeota archaeon]|nr:hypothetical protein [Candidatus Lokiarchaeota archaeon]